MNNEYPKDYVWQIEFSNSFPSMRVRFTVVAKTYEEAIGKANRVISEMRMSACYKL